MTRPRGNSFSEVKRRPRGNSINVEHVKRSKEEVWDTALEKDIGGGAIIQLDGLGSESHTVFARMVPSSTTIDKTIDVTIGKVVDVMVTEGWRNIAKSILEDHVHIEKDEYPSAKELLKLGAVWLLNETEWKKGGGAHAHRLAEKDEDMVPAWNDMTLRVHYHPERFHACNDVDWTKYCKGLLIDKSVQANINGEEPHVPISGLPDSKDGVIVYEDDNIGYAVINKPGSMPVYATMENHAEDAVSMFKAGVKKRNEGNPYHRKLYVSIPTRLEDETSGLVVVAKRKEFCSYMTKIAHEHNRTPQNAGLTQKFKCLVCVKDAGTMDKVEHFQKAGTIITHYLDVKSPAPKKFFRYRPKNTHGRDIQQCQMRILKVGDDSFRAACVLSKYGDSVDSCLAHCLWGYTSEHPAEDIGVKYVMELEIELLTHKPHQIRGQLSALGLPIVGDTMYGGGSCGYRSHHHGWHRMALQCCELSFMEPNWSPHHESSDDEEKKEKDNDSDNNSDKNEKLLLEPSERHCHFRLNGGWWTGYLQQYEMYLQSY